MASGIVTMVSALGTGSRIAVIADMTARIRCLYFSSSSGAGIECDPPWLEGVAQKVKQEILGWIHERIGEEQLDFEFQVSCRLPGRLPPLITVDCSPAGAALAVSILEGLFHREGVIASSRPDTVFSGSAEALSVVEVTGAARSDQQAAAQGQGKTLLAPFLTGDQRLSTLDELFDRAFEGNRPTDCVRRTLELAILLGRVEEVGLYSHYREARRLAGQDKARAARYIRESMNALRGSPLIRLALQGLQLCLERETGQVFTRDSDRALAEFAGELKRMGCRALQVDQMARHAFLLREEKREEDAATVMRRLERESQDLFQEVENRDRTPIAMVPYMQGRLAYYRGDFQESLDRYAEACRLIGRPIDSVFEETLSDLYNSAGKDFNDIYDFPMALELFARALEIRRRGSLEEKIARTKGSAAEALLRLGVLPGAESLYREDLDNLKRIGQRRDIPRVQNYLGNALLAQGSYGKAEELFRSTLDQYETARDFRNLPYSLLGLFLALLGQGKRTDEMASLIAPHEAGFPSKGTEVLPVANLHLVRGKLRQKAGQFEAAFSDLCQAIALLDQEQYTVEAAVVLLEAAAIFVRPGAEGESGSLETMTQEALRGLRKRHPDLSLPSGDASTGLLEAASWLLQFFERTHASGRRYFGEITKLESGNSTYARFWPEVTTQIEEKPCLRSPDAFFEEMRGYVRRACERWASPSEALEDIRRAQEMVFPYNVVFRVIP